jgi:hypothetical protein
MCRTVNYLHRLWGGEAVRQRCTEAVEQWATEAVSVRKQESRQ